MRFLTREGWRRPARKSSVRRLDALARLSVSLLVPSTSIGVFELSTRPRRFALLSHVNAEKREEPCQQVIDETDGSLPNGLARLPHQVGEQGQQDQERHLLEQPGEEPPAEPGGDEAGGEKDPNASQENGQENQPLPPCRRCPEHPQPD